MFYYLSSVLIIIFEVMCCKIFFESFCDNLKEPIKGKKILIIILVLLDFVCALLLSRWFIVKQIVIIMVIAIIMHIYFEISIKKATIFAMLYQCLLLVVDYIAYAINNNLLVCKEVTAREYAMVESLVIVFGKIALFLSVLIIKRHFEKKATELLADTEWIRFLFFPIFTIITIASMIMGFQYIENQMQANVLYTIAFGMEGMNLVVYYLINDIVKREAELHEKKIFELQVKNQMEMYHSISENFEKQKRKSHEFKNQILCIEALVKNQEYKELNKYVSEISKKINDEQNIIDTNHVIANSILNIKYQEARSKRIVFVFKVNDLSEIEMSDEDIVVLLANLLDNAIEACEKCESKRILKLKFIKEKELIILSVKNTYSCPLIYENNEIKTSKVILPEEHGIGIKNIISIIEKYNGSYVIQNDNEEFFFSIIFPI